MLKQGFPSFENLFATKVLFSLWIPCKRQEIFTSTLWISKNHKRLYRQMRVLPWIFGRFDFSGYDQFCKNSCFSQLIKYFWDKSMLILRTRHLYRPSDDLYRSQSKIKTIKMYSRMRTLLRQNGKITCKIGKYFILILKAFFSMSNLIRNILILFARK